MLNLDALKFEPVANIVNKYIGNRKLVLLDNNTLMRKLLSENYNIEPIKIIEKNNCENSVEYYELLEFVSKSDEYYICVSSCKYNEQLKLLLESYGYKEFKDFVFTYHKRITLPPMTRDYADEYGNKVISTGKFKVVLAPLAGNCVVDISETVYAAGDSNIVMGGCNGQIEIDEYCKFDYNAHLEIFSYARIVIHAKSTFTGNFTARATGGSVIEIGKDCMFSNDVEVYAGDGHSIFDIESHERLNKCYPHNEKNKILLGEHVWVGLKTIILASKIGKNSIVGAGSVVKGELPESCIAVGNPAVVKKKGVTWSRNNYATSISECGEEFKNI